ncbi:MAG: tryptophan synthase subunit alpha [FCB group bacterium]|nr:tryptophan synthase subunit alpha [FCB group bacterium]
MIKHNTVMDLSKVFDQCRSGHRAAVMPFLTAGFPSEKLFGKLLAEVVKAGADMIEIGVPFSDPLADGKSIQKSSEQALANGINMDRTLKLCTKTMKGVSTPLILMSYINPILAYGAELLLKRMHRTGFRGLIVPDLVPEEGQEMERLCRQEKIDLIYLLAPTSTAERRKQIVNRSSGFVYLVSIVGVTGARKSFPPEIHSWIQQVKRESPLPVCVGFGISDHRQAKAIARNADGVIVGSALTEIIRQAENEEDMIANVESFVSQLRNKV